jgi:hypothetical protein
MFHFDYFPNAYLLLLFLQYGLALAQSGRNLDQFNYRSTKGSDYGPADWDKIQCPDNNVCVSFSI